MEQATAKKKGPFKYREYPDVDYLTFGIPGKENIPPLNAYQSVEDIQPIQLEDAPTNTYGRGDVEQLNLLRKRVDKTINLGIPVGKAFPIPAKSRSSIYEYVKKAYPEMKFGIAYTKDQPFARVVRKA